MLEHVDKFGIYLNVETGKVVRITSPYWFPPDNEWVVVTKEVNATLTEISDTKSVLFKRGWGLRGRIEYLTKIPTYYYLYRVGGISLKDEKERKGPQCGGEWLLDAPIHDIFYFKCDDCRLVSNISWDQLK